MKNDTFHHGTYAFGWQCLERGKAPDRVEAREPERMNPTVGWSIALLVSSALWWGLWKAGSSLASALL